MNSPSRRRRLSLRTRITVAFIATILLLGMVLLLGLSAIRNLNNGMDSVIQNRVPIVQALQDMRFSGVRIVASASEAVLIHQQARRSGTGVEAALAQEDRLRREARELYRESLDRYARLVEQFGEDDDRSLTRLMMAGNALVRAGDEMLELTRRGASGSQVIEAKERFETEEQAYLSAVSGLLAGHKIGLNDTATSLQGEIVQGASTLGIAGLVAIAATLFIALRVAGRVSGPIEGLTSAAAALSGTGEEADADEVITLTRTFERLASELKSTTVSRDFLNAVVKSMSDSLVILDTSSTVVMANDATLRMLGYSKRELHGQPSTKLLVDDSQREAESTAERELLALLNGTCETHYQSRDGTLIPVSVTGSVLRAANGQRLGGILMAQDISERQRIQEALVNSKERAEAATRAKSQFLANMSHEIRTPMNGVLGMADLLLAEDLDHHTRGYAESIRRSGESLLTLINDLLDFSKIEAGRLELLDEPFDLLELVEDVTSLLAASAHEKRIELAVVVDTTLPRVVFGDAPRLRQVLTNLLGNAIKFTERGEVILRVEPEVDEHGAATWRVSVLDTGIGIPDEMLEHLFEPFYQADAGMSRRFGGTGLGLAISRHLLDLMGSEIHVESVPGTGSTFWFALPLATAGAPSLTTVEPALGNAAALVVSSHGPTREGLEAQLNRLGVDCRSMGAGATALEWLRARAENDDPPCCIFLDRWLGDMAEIDFARTLIAESLVRDAHLIALCRIGEESNLAAAWNQVGIHRYLTRPVRLSALRDSLTRGEHDAGVGSGVRRERTDVVFDAHVLLAEDHPVNQDVVVNMLRLLGCRSTVAADGEDALAALDRETFGLVLMDCDMPGMDGFEATRLIREKEAATGAARLPIIALTANALRGDRERCLAAGMDDYLSKPMTRQHLRSMLGYWLAPGPLPSEPLATTSVSEADVPITTPTTHPPGADEPIDADVIRPLQATSDGFLRAIVDKYAQSYVEDMVKLSEALQSGSCEAVRKSAHRFKSASASLGATGVSAACLAIEFAAREQRLDDVPELIEAVRREYDRAIVTLERMSRDSV